MNNNNNSNQQQQRSCTYNCRNDHRLVGGLIVSTVGFFMLFVLAMCSRRKSALERSSNDASSASDNDVAPTPTTNNDPNGTTTTAVTTTTLPAVNRWMSHMTSSQRNMIVMEFLPTTKFKDSIARQTITATNEHVGDPGSAGILELTEPSSAMAIPHGHDDNDDEAEDQDEEDDHESILESGGGTPALAVNSTVMTPKSVDTAKTTTIITPLSSSLRECAVCLEAFCDNDEICTSNNPECPHVFHRSCIHSWLMRQEECPCCRRPYLQFDPLEEILF